MPCGPTFSPKGSGAELGSLQLAGSLGSCRCSGPFSFVGGETCSPNLPKTDGWKRAEGAVDLLLQEVPRYVVMIDIPQQGEAVHHIETKAKLDAEWLPRFNDALKEFGAWCNDREMWQRKTLPPASCCGAPACRLATPSRRFTSAM